MKVKGKGVKFVRYGGLSPIKQIGYDASMPTFHCPPARKGFYAFLWSYIEPFLLSGGTREIGGIDGKSNRVKYVLDENGDFLPENHKQGSKYFGVKSKEYRKICEEYSTWAKNRDKIFSEGKGWMDVYAQIGTDPRDSFKGQGYVLATWNSKPKIFTVNEDGLLWHHLGHQLKPGQFIKEKGSWTLSKFSDYCHALHEEFHSMSSDNPFKVLGGKGQNFMKTKRPTFGFSIDHLEVFFEKIK